MDEPIPARLEIDESGDRVLAVRGELDAHSVTWLEERLSGLGAGSDVTLEMSGVDFIDSSGLRVILTEHQRLRDGGHRLVIRSPSAAVSRLLEITDLTEHLDVE